VEIGGRAYQVKAGFAELALNTGAAILPFYGRILPDSRSQIHFLPPLEPGAGSRAVQAERLVNQYVAFVNRVWSESPAILWWNRIRRHLMRPAACG
jgi:lauroyl/myristoyl acyltransferase